METPEPKEHTNGSTALVSVQIQEAVERALADVQQFIDSPGAKDKMEYVLVRQVADNPDLQKCTPGSFAVAIYQMFNLGLDPRGQNEAWLIPRAGKAVMQAGYAGKRKLALNDPRVLDVYTSIIYENDSYDVDPRNGQPLHTYRHFKPRGAPIGYIGVARFYGDIYHVEEMSIEEMRVWRDTYSAAAKKNVWKENRGVEGLRQDPFAAMALATMLRRICHPRHMSLSPEAQEAFALDDTLYGRTKDVTPDANPYVPTDNQHAQNVRDLSGDHDAATQARQRATRPEPAPVPDKQPVTNADSKDRVQTKEERKLSLAAMKLARKAAAEAGISVAVFLTAVDTLAPLGFSRDYLTPETYDDFEGWVSYAVDEFQADPADVPPPIVAEDQGQEDTPLDVEMDVEKSWGPERFGFAL